MSDGIQIQRKSFGPRTKTDTVKDSCPFWTTLGCAVKEIPCRYGLTEIKVPRGCPLRYGSVTTVVSLVPMTPDALRAEAEKVAADIYLKVKCGHPEGSEITDAITTFAKEYADCVSKERSVDTLTADALRAEAAEADFSCRVCGVQCDVAPDPPGRAVCPAHCEDHDFEYVRGDRGHFCKHCNMERPSDWNAGDW